MCSKRIRFSVSWKSLVDRVIKQEKYLFHSLSWKRPYPLWLQDQETRLPSIQKITMFRLKIMWSLSCVFWMQIGKRIKLEKYYGLIYVGLQIQQWVHLRLHQGRTINSENNARRFRNVEQFTRSIISVQSSMVDTYENENSNRRNLCARNRIIIDWTRK